MRLLLIKEEQIVTGNILELAEFLRIARANLESQNKPEFEIKILLDVAMKQWLSQRQRRR